MMHLRTRHPRAPEAGPSLLPSARIRPAFGLLLWLALASCGPVNTPATHTGGLDAGSPIIDIGSCCVRYDREADLTRVYTGEGATTSSWRPVVDPQGRPHPPGHPDDAYYTGNRPRQAGETIPKTYRYVDPTGPGGLSIALARRWPQLKRVRFSQYDSHEDGSLTPKGERQVEAWIRDKYGPGEVWRLGAGGFSVAYRVCPAKRECKVVKIRKMPPNFAEWKRIEQARKAAEELKRDLAMFEVGRIMVAGARYLGPEGQPAPFLIGGQEVAPLAAPRTDDAPGQLAAVAEPTHAGLLSRGVVEQELIAFHSTADIEAVMAAAAARDSAARREALAQLPANGPWTERHLQVFFDRYTQTSKLGPEVHKTERFVTDCARFGALPAVAAYCLTLRRAFQIPDDFLDRVRALEQMYRDTAAEVIRFSRANFGRALGNRAADGQVREIGLDYNHGHNAGWDPQRRRFVIFDL